MIEDTWSEDCYAELMSDKPIILACDSETSGLTWKDTAFGVSFAWRAGEELRSGYIDMRYHDDLWLKVKSWVMLDKPRIIGHNWKFDAHKLGLYPNNFEDTCLMVYLLNEHYPKKLKVLAAKILKESTDEADVLKRVRAKLKLKASDGYDKLPLSVVAPYAIRDAEYTLRLFERLEKKYEGDEELLEVYAMEKQLLLCVAGTERRGMAVDIDYAKSMVIKLGDEILQIHREISEIVGKPVGRNEAVSIRDGEYKNGRPKFRKEKPGEFNPNSPDQILEFFYSVGVEASGTKDNVLQALTHPLADALLRLRPLLKDRNTYFRPMVEEAEWDEDLRKWILHPNFNLTETKTHRSSSSKVKE